LHDLDCDSIAACAADLGIGSLIQTQYYECRLHAGRDQLDYLAAFSRSAATALHRKLVEAKAGTTDNAGWSPVLSLLSRWGDRRSLVSERVPTVWFEFDDIRSAAAAPVPSVSVCLIPGYRYDRPLPETTADDSLETLLDALEGLETPRTAALSACFAALPRQGRFIHLSVMLGRPARAVKLYGTLPRAQLAGYLRRIAWAGDHDAVAAALAAHYPEDLLGQEIFIDLDLENFRDPGRASLGLALAQQHLLAGGEADPARPQTLARWVAAGLCAPEKARDLQQYMATTVVPGGRRFLDLKLVWQASAGLSAKAYLGRVR
jgi:hypothetical protein